MEIVAGLFECPVFSCLGVLGLVKVSLCSKKMALVNKLVFLCPAFESNHPEVKKKKACFQLSHLDAS